MYDGRLGRRWNVDPKYSASESRYAVNGNNPIIYIDPLGDFKSKFGARVFKWTNGGGRIGQDAKSGQWYVAKRIEDKSSDITIKRTFDWNSSTQPYNGSGRNHSARSLMAKISGVDGKVNSLVDLAPNSLFQNSSVQLEGSSLNKVIKDPAVQNMENLIVSQVRNDTKYGNEAFSLPYSKEVQLGGRRGSLNPFSSEGLKTWSVGFNPLTWAVRTITIEAQVQVNAEGCMTVTYNFSDVLDLRPEKGGKVYFGGSDAPFNWMGDGNRPWQYNSATSILGLIYHDYLGGNDKMKINATWQSNR